MPNTSLIQIKTDTGWESMLALRGKQGSIITQIKYLDTDPNGNYIYEMTCNGGSADEQTYQFTVPKTPSSSFFVEAQVDNWTSTGTTGYEGTFDVPGYDNDTMAGFPAPIADSTQEWMNCTIVATKVEKKSTTPLVSTVTLHSDVQPSKLIKLVFYVTTDKKV